MGESYTDGIKCYIIEIDRSKIVISHTPTNKILCLNLTPFFPPLGILAEHASQTAVVLSSSATGKNFQTGEDMFTNDDEMSATQAESHCNLMLQSLALGKRMNLE